VTARLISYIAAAAVAALLVATISAERLVSYASVPALALFALLLGLLDAAIWPLLGRMPALSGCWPFTLAAFLLNAAIFWLAGQVVPGMTVSMPGAIAGGAIGAIAAAAVFTMLDERFANG
jgi:uncharacterized membrane protein YvlD (DUF360 family)